MKQIAILKVFETSVDYDTIATHVTSEPNFSWIEIDDKEAARLQNLCREFNRHRYQFASRPAYELMYVEITKEKELPALFAELEAVMEKNRKVAEAAAEKARKAAEKRKEATAEATRLKKLKQLQKLQEELGVKE